MLRIAVCWAGLFLIGLAHWFHESFDSPSVEQIVYHLRFNEGLADSAGGAFVITFAVVCLLLPTLGTVLLMLALRVSGPRLGAWVAASMPALIMAAGLLVLGSQLSALAYARSFFGADLFAKLYVPPQGVTVQARQPKNLVLVYVESLEDAYGDRALFGADLLAPLRALQATRFQHYDPAPGTNWTIAAIVATQCGVPLRSLGLTDPSRTRGGVRTFLPGAMCLGDVLKAHGYRNVYLGGARLAFSGKGIFLGDHGYDERYGRAEWIERGAAKAGMSDWGLYDDDLFAQARSRLKQLHASGERFNLTLLTLDTHHPEGLYSPRCKRDGVVNFEGIVGCTARLVAEFVEFAQREGMLKDTRVVILGDHLALPNPVQALLEREPRRTMFNAFIPGATESKLTEDVLPFDLYPTILQFIGFDVVGGRLGLGHAAFSGPGAAPRSDADRSALLEDSLNSSEAYADLWRPRP
jgi:phosphoglycerol transferase